MLDIMTLASSAVAVLAPLLSKAIEKGAETVGESTVTTLFDKLKQSLGHEGAKEAIDDLAKQPADADAQAVLRVQLRKALEAEPELATKLREWLATAQAETHINLKVEGDNNKVVQATGNSNTISIS